MECIVSYMEHRDPTSPEVAAVIRGMIARVGLSQGDLAERALISPTTLNRRLNGSEFTYPELRAIARALGTSVTSILTDAERNVGRIAA